MAFMGLGFRGLGVKKDCRGFAGALRNSPKLKKQFGGCGAARRAQFKSSYLLPGSTDVFHGMRGCTPLESIVIWNGTLNRLNCTLHGHMDDVTPNTKALYNPLLQSLKTCNR